MRTLKERIDEAAAAHDIHTILGTRKKSILCPLPGHIHHNHSPSFSIFFRGSKQRWKCHGQCNREGDVIDLVGELRVPGYDKRSPQHVERALGLLDDRYEIEIVQPPRQISLIGNEWQDFCPPGPEVIAYAQQRGLNQATIEKFRLGQFGDNLTMPAFEEGRLIGVKMRRLNAGERNRFWSLEGSRVGLFNHEAVAYQTGPIFIVKAEIPAMLLDQLGFRACAPNAGEASWLEKWKVELALGDPKIVIGDNDEPGRALGEKRARLFSARLVFPPAEFQDVDKWILAEGERAVQQIKEWANGQ